MTLNIAGLLGTGQRTRYVAACVGIGLSLWLTLPCLAAPAQLLGERNFRLGKNGSDQMVFPVNESGTLLVKVRIKQPIAQASVQLLLEGPGGLRVEKQGSAPLRLRYTVTATSPGETWRASVINAGKLPNLVGRVTVEIESSGKSTVAPADDSTIVSSKTATSKTATGKTVTGKTGVTDGRVSIIDNRRLRAVCRDRNPDISVQLDLELGTGVLLMRFNHVFSFAARQTSEHRIEMRGSGQHPLYLDLAKETIFFDSGERGIFCRARIYRHGED